MSTLTPSSKRQTKKTPHLRPPNTVGFPCRAMSGCSGVAKSEVPGHIELTHPRIFGGLVFGQEGLRNKFQRPNITHEHIKHIFNVLDGVGPDLPPQKPHQKFQSTLFTELLWRAGRGAHPDNGSGPWTPGYPAGFSLAPSTLGYS